MTGTNPPSRSFLAASILIGVFLTLEPTVLAQERVTLEGRVQTNQGLTLTSGVHITLETTEGREVAQQFADSGGDFQFSGLEKLSYNLIVSAQDFNTFEETIDLHYTGGSYEANVNLVPIGQTTANGSALRSRSDQSAPKSARKDNTKGTRALKSKKLAQAKIYFEQALQVDPCYARAQSNLALVLSQEHNMAEAEKLLWKAIKCDPDFLDSYIELGEFLNAERKFPESKNVLQQGVRRVPSAWQFYYQIGLADYGEANYTQALQDFLKARSLSTPPPSKLYVKLADCYVKLQNFPKADAEMGSYLQADPKGPYAARVKQIMRQMRAAGVLGAKTSPSSLSSKQEL
ncbi:MAG TPA: tetratricopeptide repeat protein [Terriglobia bacterium]|nr:tetratricopeptide repeat protein [Terriglobia bacterium]